MPKRKKKRNPVKRVPPAIGPAVAGARERMAALYEAIAPDAEKRYGSRGKEVAARTAWAKFKTEYRKQAGKWVKRKNPAPMDPHKRRVRKNDAASQGNAVGRAARAFEKFHWGLKPKKIKEVKIDVPEAAHSLGELREIVYYTEKGNEGPGLYHHKFESPYADLCSGPDGKMLFTVGGGFKVKPEGIVG